MKFRSRLCRGMLVLGAAVTGAASGRGVASQGQQGGILRLAVPLLDSVDPALSYSPGGWALLDTSCARLMTFLTNRHRRGSESFPRSRRTSRVSRPTRRPTRSGCAGGSVSATAHRSRRTRSPAPSTAPPSGIDPREPSTPETSPAPQTCSPAGPRPRRGSPPAEYTLTCGSRGRRRFRGQVDDAVLLRVLQAARWIPRASARSRRGPNVVDYRPGERVMIRRNRFYGGNRPRHLDGFDVDLRAASTGRTPTGRAGRCGLGLRCARKYFEPVRVLAAKYGLNSSQFFVRPGSSSPTSSSTWLGRSSANPRLRRAVNFALDPELRRARNRHAVPAPHRPVCPPPSRGSRTPTSIRSSARASREHARSRAATYAAEGTLYSNNAPHYFTIARLVTSQLAEIGLEVEAKPMPFTAYFNDSSNRESPGTSRPPSGGRTSWIPPPTSTGSSTVAERGHELGRFDSPELNRSMR